MLDDRQLEATIVKLVRDYYLQHRTDKGVNFCDIVKAVMNSKEMQSAIDREICLTMYKIGGEYDCDDDNSPNGLVAWWRMYFDYLPILLPPEPEPSPGEIPWPPLKLRR